MVCHSGFFIRLFLYSFEDDDYIVPEQDYADAFISNKVGFNPPSVSTSVFLRYVIVKKYSENFWFTELFYGIFIIFCGKV